MIAILKHLSLARQKGCPAVRCSTSRSKTLSGLSLKDAVNTATAGETHP